MSVLYSGDVAWKERKTRMWSGGGYEIDRCQLWFSGSRPDYQKFINSLSRFQQLPGFESMRLDNWQSVENTPSFPAVVLNFIGLKDGNNLPPVKAVDGTSFQSAQGSGTDTATHQVVSGTINYNAARTSYTWFENSEPPDVPKYNQVRKPIDPLSPDNIVSYSIQNEDTGKTVNNVPLSSFVAVFNSLIKRNIVADYKREPLIPGALWACTSEVDYKVVN